MGAFLGGTVLPALGDFFTGVGLPVITWVLFAARLALLVAAAFFAYWRFSEGGVWNYTIGILTGIFGLVTLVPTVALFTSLGASTAEYRNESFQGAADGIGFLLVPVLAVIFVIGLIGHEDHRKFWLLSLIAYPVIGIGMFGIYALTSYYSLDGIMGVATTVGTALVILGMNRGWSED